MPGENGEGHVDGFDESEEIDESELVTIVDEAGKEYACVVLAVADVDDQDYALLAPQDQLADDEAEELELFIFRYEVDTDEQVERFDYVEDEAVYKKVEAFFSQLMEQADEDEDEA